MSSRARRRVAIGTFDGVHVGHRAVIGDADTVLTFEPHPLQVIHPEAAPKLIMPFAVKRDVIEGLGVEELVVIRFDREFASIDPVDFCERDPGRQARRRARLGRRELPLRRRAKGTPELLASRDGVRDRGRAAGRGRRRDRLLDPDPGPGRRRRGRRVAGRFLGAPFMVEGEVAAAIGAAARSASRPPTWSPTTPSSAPGTASTRRFANGRPAAVNVGVRPTFETGRGVLIETYIIDHDEDLYGKPPAGRLRERLRGEKRFAGAEDLIAQMQRDVEEARRGLC